MLLGAICGGSALAGLAPLQVEEQRRRFIGAADDGIRGMLGRASAPRRSLLAPLLEGERRLRIAPVHRLVRRESLRLSSCVCVPFHLPARWNSLMFHNGCCTRPFLTSPKSQCWLPHLLYLLGKLVKLDKIGRSCSHLNGARVLATSARASTSLRQQWAALARAQTRPLGRHRLAVAVAVAAAAARSRRMRMATTR